MISIYLSCIVAEGKVNYIRAQIEDDSAMVVSDSSLRYEGDS